MRFFLAFGGFALLFVALFMNCSPDGQLSTGSMQTSLMVKSWNFADPQQFAYSNNELFLTSSTASLAAVANFVDSAAEFNKGTHSGTAYNNGMLSLEPNKTSGTYESNIFDAGVSSPWTSMLWQTSVPFLKELALTSDAIGDYPGLSAGLSSNLVGLWHFNETTPYTGTLGEIKDSSGRNRHGYSASGTVTQGPNGRFNRDLVFNTYNVIRAVIPNPVVGARSNMTFSLWVKSPPITVDPAIQSNQFQIMTMGGGAGRAWFFQSFSGQTPTFCANTYFGTPTSDYYFGCESGTQFPTADNQWHHLVATYNRTGFAKFYLDGKFISQTNISASANIDWDAVTDLTLGEFPYQQRQFKGEMDELAVWARELSASEVLHVYRRGANRVQMQVRSCDDKNCSGETWSGYFSELNNSSANSANINLNVSNNRFFQYRILLESDDKNNLPAVSSLSVTPVPRYFSAPAALLAQAGIFFDRPLSKFDVTATGTCALKVQFSNDNGKSFKYWDGGKWAIADGTATQSADLNISNQNIGSFAVSGIFRFRIFLVPSGNSPCEINTPQIL
jgi:hypothetical protein